jgi:putative ABC transport system permease protein
VQKDYARRHHLTVGSTMSAFFARTGTRTLRVVSIFDEDMFGMFFVSLSQYQRDFATQEDAGILVPLRAGQSASAAKATASGYLKDFPNLKVRTKAEYKNLRAGQITLFLRLFYALLAMAVIIAIFGIVLTLALSVFERTREIGLLRAIGLSRRAVRAMIRVEAIIVALIGALVGLVLGAFLGIASVSAIPQFKTISIPWGSMLVFFVAAGIFGVLAAILPARRAARLNILMAIQSE